MTIRLLPLLCTFMALGCLPNSKSVGEGESSGGESESGTAGTETNASSTAGMSASSASMSSTGTGTGTSAGTSGAESTSSISMTATDASQGLDSSSTGDVACQKEDCSCPEGQEPAGSCVDGEFVCECFATSCPFEEIVCQMVEDGEVSIDDIVDCGTLTLMDDAAAWEAGQTCVLDAFAGERAYKVFAEQQGIDSTVWRALGGLIGFVYQPVEYYYDGGGFDGSEQVTMRNCAPVLLDDCIVEPGLLCIACAENEDSSQICFAPGE